MHLQKITENFKSIFCGGIFDSDHVTKKSYPEKFLRNMEPNTQFIVVGFDKDSHPVCQFIHDFQDNMDHHDHLNDKTFFTLNAGVVGKLKWQKTYQVTLVKKLNKLESRQLEQVSILITKDSMVG